MKISSAKFIKGVVGTNEILDDGKPQIAFIGRSNVGKSSVINSLVERKALARTSSFPGRTQEINLFLINNSFYLVDLPGYGFTRTSKALRDRLEQLINWYLFTSPYIQEKIVLIIDAHIGPQENDLEILRCLEKYKKNIIVVANKIDKIKKSEYESQLENIQEVIGGHLVIPYSAKKKIGVTALLDEMIF
ncbi:MAG: ribosome biogenesis GTP-binding protein YsxC [Candidatus Jacksonbacteria bacterium RIFOXYC2_FULL_44_29]|nr:MAG: putative GTP-binding protein EngB [Parcubacteria group bacterium GW2011_GWC2_44_22]OGY74812.1 MAG: ribosome biogenesis GTP-binding protein YsxC [Candidatus Jacksonbacteria bacterium RIFOXYA2_FULL_43_12]OGY77751.1 MAG: ribosome biogenesis GTP-binding protein YsxC [Candidatus Jacksonbacteria bacterium RIFOXYB2_FULL_44_15]OGY78887.1 MAG: ribosome biogenesis GTP-binding protein YsxC [Candidatus Jacksonbacteria bacterium RIFOXYD2_FULL_43_21]OGY79134.1 MAG: ribosome biogenesis GTP-binding pro